MVKRHLKVSHYVMDHLAPVERKRYFPINTPRMHEPESKPLEPSGGDEQAHD
jgi:hypothetical protein